MEPRSAERGNQVFYLSGSTAILGLQWSHAQLSVETQPVKVFEGFFTALQWSHAQLSVETKGMRHSVQPRAPASMEPRSAERGNTANIRALRGCIEASMEPRSAERGNEATSDRTVRRCCPLQWSHAQLSVETRPRWKL